MWLQSILKDNYHTTYTVLMKAREIRKWRHESWDVKRWCWSIMIWNDSIILIELFISMYNVQRELQDEHSICTVLWRKTMIETAQLCYDERMMKVIIWCWYVFWLFADNDFFMSFELNWWLNNMTVLIIDIKKTLLVEIHNTDWFHLQLCATDFEHLLNIHISKAAFRFICDDHWNYFLLFIFFTYSITIRNIHERYTKDEKNRNQDTVWVTVILSGSSFLHSSLHSFLKSFLHSLTAQLQECSQSFRVLADHSLNKRFTAR